MRGKRELSKGGVCVSPGAELTWLGMSEERMLVAMDSSGLVLALTRVIIIFFIDKICFEVYIFWHGQKAGLLYVLFYYVQMCWCIAVLCGV